MKVSATWKCIFGSVEGGKIPGQIEFRSVRQAKKTHAIHMYYKVSKRESGLSLGSSLYICVCVCVCVCVYYKSAKNVTLVGELYIYIYIYI